MHVISCDYNLIKSIGEAIPAAMNFIDGVSFCPVGALVFRHPVFFILINTLIDPFSVFTLK
jgi:hypothetical protein